MKDIYVYGITSNELLPGQLKCESVDFGGEVQFYPYKDLVIAISKVQQDKLEEHGIKQRLQQDIEWTKRNVQAHHNVIVELTRKGTTIPFRFATIFHSQENLERMLKENYLKFKDLLFYLSGKQEVGVRVYFDYEKAKHVVKQREMAGAGVNGNSNRQTEGVSKGMQWFFEKKQEQQVEQQLHQLIEDTLKQAFETFDRQAVRSALSQPIPVDPLSKRGEMVLNAAFLVKSNGFGRFRSIAKRLALEVQPKGFEIEVTGPWPPYNFVTTQAGQA